MANQSMIWISINLIYKKMWQHKIQKKKKIEQFRLIGHLLWEGSQVKNDNSSGDDKNSSTL